MLVLHSWTLEIKDKRLGGDTLVPSGLYTRLCHAFSSFYFFNYEQRYLSIYWTDFHDLFTKWKVFAWFFLIRSSLPIPQRTLPWQPIKVEKSAFFTLSRCQKGLQYRNSDFKRLHRITISTSCTILVTFSPETSEFTLLTIAPFLWRHGKNRHITPNISECPGPTLTYFTGLVGVLVGMIFQIFLWRSPKGCFYGNQLNMGDVCKRRMNKFTLCFGIRQRIGRS